MNFFSFYKKKFSFNIFSTNWLDLLIKKTYRMLKIKKIQTLKENLRLVSIYHLTNQGLLSYHFAMYTHSYKICTITANVGSLMKNIWLRFCMSNFNRFFQSSSTNVWRSTFGYLNSPLSGQPFFYNDLI